MQNVLQQNSALKLVLTYSELAERLQVSLPESDRVIHAVAFDTRRIVEGSETAFFALKGDFRDGHEFIQDAYEKGVRTFIVSQKIDKKHHLGAQFIEVEDPLKALQLLAQHHREQFNFPVVAITGSAGKTIVKEWLGQLLDPHFRVVRSPKSYNSQLGVALSLLELTADCEIALIEAGISKPDEMQALETMIQPTIGVFTSLGSAHAENFESRDAQMAEKLKLFQRCSKVLVYHSIPVNFGDPKFVSVHNKSYEHFLKLLPFHDEMSRRNGALVVATARALGLEDEHIEAGLGHLDRVALRLETFEGTHNNLIINDTYNLDLDAFRSSLEYQLSIAKGKNRIVLIGTDENTEEWKAILDDFSPIDYHFVSSVEEEIPEFRNSAILIKGKRSLHMEKLALRMRAKKHQTFVEINLSHIRNNISYFKSLVPSETKILAMVKASSYGSGIEEIGRYLERIGVNYLGVAYADEGVQLRQAGVQLPILVMNTEESGFEDCVKYNLEPCIYALEQLDAFIKRLIYEGRTNYPIHIKLETGMNRLGFVFDQLLPLVQLIQRQPEIRIQSVYSHLATSDNRKSNFIETQVERFEQSFNYLAAQFSYSFDRHILNSEGVLNFPQHHFDMVRLGIGMYGQSMNSSAKQHLKDVVHWFSAISQVRKVSAGATVGYGQMGVKDQDTTIAIVPVGYADGFRRSLGRGKGGVYIRDTYCPVIGNVCMDMIMVDIADLDAHAGEVVEIIGPNQSLESLAETMGTIPYEVLTSISKRVHRVYIEN